MKPDKQKSAPGTHDTIHADLFESLPIGIFRFGDDFQWIKANSAVAEIMGYPDPDAFVQATGEFYRCFVHDEDRKRFEHILSVESLVSRFETRLYHKDRRIVWVSLSVRVIRDKAGKISFYEGHLQDITQLKQVMNISSILANISHAVSTTRDLSHLYRAIHVILKKYVDTTNFFIAIVDEKGDRLLFPYYRDELDGVWDIGNISDPETKSLSLKVIRGGKPLFVTKSQIDAHGLGVIGPLPEVWIGVPLKIKESVIGVMAIQHYTNPHHYSEDDVNIMTSVSEQIAMAIERKMSEDALRESEEKYRNILESIEDGYFEVDIAGNFTFFNDCMCRIFGYAKAELLGMNNREYMDKENAQKVFKAFNELYRQGTPTKALDWKMIRKNGSEGFIETVVSLIKDSNGHRIGFRGMARDVTERKHSEEEKNRLEAQLLQTRKMEGIGTLAGGIAHDFNNILGIIVGNTELAINDVSEWNPARANLEEIRTACLRARDVVKQILAFSRQTKVEHIPVKIDTIVIEAITLLRSSIPATITINQNIPGDVGTILADATQINQVLINLSTNASHAMSEDGGIFDVSLENIELDETTAALYQGLNPGRYVKLTLSDTGHGMSPEVVDRIFEPYFTTKAVGQGTGMGLSVVHGIVKDHGGVINVESKPGRGTTFNLLFPAVNVRVKPEFKTVDTIATGTENILFVDDEASLAFMTEKMLERLGYNVVTRTKPYDALEHFHKQPEAFDLVITDMTMPEMTGEELVRGLIQIRPDIPIIIATGYSEKMDEEKAGQIGIKAFIMKPIRMAELASTVRKVLDKEQRHLEPS